MKLHLVVFLCLTVGLLGLTCGAWARQVPHDPAQPVPSAVLMPKAAPVADLAQHAPDAPVAHLDDATSDGAIKEAVSRPRDVAGEIVKQAYEQPLHFLMAAGPIWLSRYLTAVPWYGWSIVPALAYREWRQWPSDRWWDPPLDAAFLILGVIGATWRGQRARRPALPLRWWRRGQGILGHVPAPGRPIRLTPPGS